MENKRPLILISNDDGYQAKGINSLVDMLRTLADIVVCAPDGPRSGFSCAFSAEIPLKLTLRSQEPGVEVWSCNGTPVDCVKMALDNIVSRRPDMVVGGINHGDNSSVNSHYSGTMGVVLEGCMKYIPSVAFSLCDHSEDADFEPMRPLVRSITQRVLKEGLPKGACLNVNFPDPSNLPCLGEAKSTPPRQGETEGVFQGETEGVFRGVRICRMAMGRWVKETVKYHHVRDYDYWWMAGEYVNDEPEAEDTDRWALNHGYVAITPTQIDVTHYGLLRQMEDWRL